MAAERHPSQVNNVLIMQYWMPSRREVAVEALAILAVPAFNLAYSIADGTSPPIVVLLTLAALTGVLAVLVLYEVIRQPFRRRVLVGKELIDTLDIWLRENGLGRAPYWMPGYSHSIVATYPDGTNIYVGVEQNRNVLAIAATRAENQTDTQQISQMQIPEWIDFTYELEIELAKFGVYYNTSQKPYSVTVWVPLPVDATLNEARVIERVDFVRRANSLVGLIAQRRMTAAILNQATRPNIPDVWQGGQAPGAAPNGPDAADHAQSKEPPSTAP